nr:nickel pincer cofactor biosynthesis protein LarC [Clostridium sp. cel8]
MKILYYDCFSGISGDMNLGAMIDIGVDKDYLISELAKLNVNEYSINVKKDTKNGISGTNVEVILSEETHHDHHDHHHDHHGADHHHHRNLPYIEKIINSSELNSKVKKISIEIFKKVAQAEAKVHNKPIEEVHFHEVGAVDSIVDIVGAAICFDYLNIDKVIASKVEVGRGFVKCAHGTLPVPAPATSEILENIPITSKVPFEATTPTGAAILSYFSSDFTDLKNFKIERTGYGIGKKDNEDIPNVLRVFIGESNESAISSESSHRGYMKDEIRLMECNIDDMNPENYDYVMDKLMKAGAEDVYLTPIIMKKGRPAVKLSVLYKKQYEDLIRNNIFLNTTTLGVRKIDLDRDILERKIEKVNTKFGEVSIKVSYYEDRKINFKPEYEDCKKLAIKNNVSIDEIKREVIKSYKE